MFYYIILNTQQKNIFMQTQIVKEEIINTEIDWTKDQLIRSKLTGDLFLYNYLQNKIINTTSIVVTRVAIGNRNKPITPNTSLGYVDSGFLKSYAEKVQSPITINFEF